MPIITKTAYWELPNSNDLGLDSTLPTLDDMAESVAKAIGVDCHVIEKNDKMRKYFIPTESIGYPGLCIYFGSNSDLTQLICGILDLSSDGSSVSYEKPSITAIAGTTNVTNKMTYHPETCVMMYDEAMDTVLFDVHPGTTMNGADVLSSMASLNNITKRSRAEFTLFFAKDVKGGVLCGVGNGHISNIRTMTSYLSNDSTQSNPQKDRQNANLLQLTKMVNYLDPDCPEMKSAYVSVIRPNEVMADKLYVSTLYANGKRWGRTGFLDSWSVNSSNAQCIGSECYFPIEPFVNY